jgi:Tfp pilus assembly protein PilE
MDKHDLGVMMIELIIVIVIIAAASGISRAVIDAITALFT